MSFDMFPDSAIDYLLENDMAEHGKNYKRMTADDGSEVGSLGKDCGHHCGVITTGGTNKHTGHCNCRECHGPSPVEIDAIFTSETGGIDPRGIV